MKKNTYILRRGRNSALTELAQLLWKKVKFASIIKRLILSKMTAILLLNFSYQLQAQNVSSYTPAANTTSISIDQNIIIDFDQIISVNDPTANIYFFNADDGFSIIYQYQMQDDEVVVSGDKLIIIPEGFWPALTNITMRVDFDAINGWSGVLVHPFQTENEVPPTLTSTSPVFGATDINIKSDLELNFNESIIVNENRSIHIRFAISGATFQNIQFSDSRVTIDSDRITVSNLTFGFNTEYRIEVLGSDAIVDAAGYSFRDLTPTSLWTFTTNEATSPEVVSLSPVNGTTDIPLTGQTFTITFNEELQQTGYFLIRDSGGSAFEEFQSGDLTFGTQSISFTPTNSFSTDEPYYITYTTVGDLEGSVSQNTTNTFWNFSTIPSTPPQIVSLTPENESLEVDVRSDLAIKLSEPVFIQDDSPSPRIEIIVLNGLAFETFDLPSARVTGLGTATITIDPTNNLVDDTKYYVRVLNAFEDDNGTDLDNIHSTNGVLDWTFDTGKPPSLTSVSPANNATGVSVDANLVMTFDESIEIFGSGTPGLTIKNVSDDSFIDFAPFSTEATGFGTNEIIINPSVDLPGSTEMYVQIGISALEDQSGDRFSGILDNTTWRFTTAEADLTAPQIDSTDPVDDATDVAITTTELILTFDEPVFETSGGFSVGAIDIIALNGGNNYNDIGVENVEIHGQDLILTVPSPGLSQNNSYYIRVPSNAIEDSSGNLFSGFSNSQTWNFTTETVDVIPPVHNTLFPADEAIDVAVNAEFTLTFNEDVFYANNFGFIHFRRKSDNQAVATASIQNDVVFNGNQISFSPSIDLPYDEDIYIHIDANKVEDAHGNLYVGFFDNETWDFATQAEPGPVLNFGAPADGSTDVLINTNINILYNQTVQKGTGFIRLRRFDNDNLLHSFDVEGTGITTSGTSININSSILISNGLLPETHLYVEVDASAVESLSGTPSAAVVKGNLSFTTGPVQWNGAAWNNGGTGPDATESAKLDGDFDSNEDGNITSNNLTISGGVNVTVNNGDHIEVSGDLTHNGASFTVESGGSLVTKGNVTGTNFTFERTTTFDESTGRYSIAGSPISGANFSTLGSNAIIYGYDETQPYNILGNEGLDRFQTPATLGHSTMQVGTGYFSAKTGDTNGLISFSGTPNNGTQNVNLSITDHPSNEDYFEGFNLVSNPYPCAIDYTSFTAANSSDIEGAIYLWDDFDSESSRGTNADYVVINLVGNVDSRQSGLSNWDGHIRSMQGFFVQAKGTGDLQLDFTDAMKVTANNDDAGYYRITNEQISFKLILQSSEGNYAETLIGMREEASLGKDQFDARLFSPAKTTIYSQISGEAYAIQGMPRMNAFEVPLGIKTEVSGIYKISIDELENLEGYNIILKDHLLNTSTEISSGNSYRFSSNEQVSNNRFSVVTSNEVTNIKELVIENLIVFQNERRNLIIRTAKDQEIRFAELISLTGQSQRLELTQLNSNEWQTRKIYETGLFMIRISTGKEEPVQKIILR